MCHLGLTEAAASLTAAEAKGPTSLPAITAWTEDTEEEAAEEEAAVVSA